MNDFIDRMIEWENGELDDSGVLILFSQLISNGMAYTLQGAYGRMARLLIESGYISEDGTILEVIA